METKLIDLRPVDLSEDLFERLELSMIQAYKQASEVNELSLEDLEQALGQMAPSGLSEGFLIRMDSAMRDWQEEGEKDAKIVPFSPDEFLSDSEQISIEESRKTGGFFWNSASVAAVALFAGVAALMMTGESLDRGGDSSSVVQQSESRGLDLSIASAALQRSGRSLDNTRATQTHSIELTKSTANRNIVGVSNEGVKRNSSDQPCRCLRVEYVDVIELRNSEGKQIKIEEPKIEYLYIPLEEN